MPLLAKLGDLCKHSLWRPLYTCVAERCCRLSRLRRVYEFIAAGQFQQAQAQLDQLKPLETRTSNRFGHPLPGPTALLRQRAACYYEAKGDLALAQGQGACAQRAYCHALAQNPQAVIRLKLAIAGLPCYHNFSTHAPSRRYTHALAHYQQTLQLIDSLLSETLPSDLANLPSLLRQHLQSSVQYICQTLNTTSPSVAPATPPITLWARPSTISLATTPKSQTIPLPTSIRPNLVPVPTSAAVESPSLAVI